MNWLTNWLINVWVNKRFSLVINQLLVQWSVEIDGLNNWCHDRYPKARKNSHTNYMLVSLVL